MKYFLIVAFLTTIVNTYSVAERAISDVQSMVFRSDGKYDVVCKNGQAEIVTIEQIKTGEVCGGNCPQPGLEVEAVFSRPTGDFFVLCKNASWEIAIAQMIQEGNVCGKACEGWKAQGGCWYMAKEKAMSCNEVCVEHGGFDLIASQHSGNPIGKHFFPENMNGDNSSPSTIEYSTFSWNINWPANGKTPDPNWRRDNTYVYCACRS